MHWFFFELRLDGRKSLPLLAGEEGLICTELLLLRRMGAGEIHLAVRSSCTDLL